MIDILFYNEFWPSVPESLPDCPWTHRFLFDRDQLPQADLVVFHVPTLKEFAQVKKYPDQQWVAWSMESEANYPALSDPAIMSHFDLTMTYQRKADVWVPYLGPGITAELMTPPQVKTEEALAVYIASNPYDRSGRSSYVSELMRHLKIDSYGRCLNNKSLSDDEGRSTKLKTIARYKFTLAFENSICLDYVTEKFFDPLIVGSVPVYLGAPDIEDFAQGDDCYIDVTDFDSPRQLAEFLRFLGNNEDEYNKYLIWKTKSLRPAFLEMVQYTAVHPFCRLAALSASKSLDNYGK